VKTSEKCTIKNRKFKLKYQFNLNQYSTVCKRNGAMYMHTILHLSIYSYFSHSSRYMYPTMNVCPHTLLYNHLIYSKFLPQEQAMKL